MREKLRDYIYISRERERDLMIGNPNDDIP